MTDEDIEEAAEEARDEVWDELKEINLRLCRIEEKLNEQMHWISWMVLKCKEAGL